MPTLEEDKVRARVRDVIAHVAPGDVTEFTPDARLIDDLDYHSLALLELAFALEEEYGLPPIDDVIAAQITTVGDVEQYILSQLSEQ
jgi:acyl carrier protein